MQQPFYRGLEPVACSLMKAFANGHTSSNTPDPIRTRKLSGERPGQYWGGGPPGKPLGCCWLFYFLRSKHFFETNYKNTNNNLHWDFAWFSLVGNIFQKNV